MRSFMTLSLFSLSRFPVGSSAMSILDGFARALAIARRCFCPLDSFAARLPEYSESSTFSRISRVLSAARDPLQPERISALSTFSDTVLPGRMP